MAVPLITKQAAAQRQIDAAIRMLLLHDEDICAIHTIAAAALSVVKDLAEERGVGPTFETRRALEVMYREQLGRNATDVTIAKEIEWRTQAIESHRATWSHRNRLANFLKHADRDADTILDLSKFEFSGEGWYTPVPANSRTGGAGTFDTIAFAIKFFMNLNLPLTIEMCLYMTWWPGIKAQTPDDIINTQSGPIHLFTVPQQLDFGRYLFRSMYKRQKRQLRKRVR